MKKNRERERERETSSESGKYFKTRFKWNIARLLQFPAMIQEFQVLHKFPYNWSTFFLLTMNANNVQIRRRWFWPSHWCARGSPMKTSTMIDELTFFFFFSFSFFFLFSFFSCFFFFKWKQQKINHIIITAWSERVYLYGTAKPLIGNQRGKIATNLLKLGAKVERWFISYKHRMIELQNSVIWVSVSNESIELQ